MKRVAERMHIERLVIPYGQTEASPVITMSSVDDSFDVRVASVGRALANTEVHIIDPATKQRLPQMAIISSRWTARRSAAHCAWQG